MIDECPRFASATQHAPGAPSVDGIRNPRRGKVHRRMTEVEVRERYPHPPAHIVTRCGQWGTAMTQAVPVDSVPVVDRCMHCFPPRAV